MFVRDSRGQARGFGARITNLQPRAGHADTCIPKFTETRTIYFSFLVRFHCTSLFALTRSHDVSAIRTDKVT